jgi:predicted nucleotidyltransferase
MDEAAEQASRIAAIGFAQDIAQFWDTRLGARLCGVYLIGSLAHGGFNSRYSDIDMALVAADAPTPEDLAAMRARAAVLSPTDAAKLSLFWTERSFGEGRFPPLDRVDYLDHAVPLVERERVRPARPSLAEIHDYLRGAPFAGWSEAVRSFSTAAELHPDNRKLYLRAHLYPARFIWSWARGTMASNDDAVALLRRGAPVGLDVDLIERALACRQAARDPDILFPERAKLLRQHAACAALVAEEP